jgi:hypothetical protein
MTHHLIRLSILLELYRIMDMTRWLSQADFMAV